MKLTFGFFPMSNSSSPPGPRNSNQSNRAPSSLQMQNDFAFSALQIFSLKKNIFICMTNLEVTSSGNGFAINVWLDSRSRTWLVPLKIGCWLLQYWLLAVSNEDWLGQTSIR